MGDTVFQYAYISPLSCISGCRQDWFVVFGASLKMSVFVEFAASSSGASLSVAKTMVSLGKCSVLKDFLSLIFFLFVALLGNDHLIVSYNDNIS